MKRYLGLKPLDHKGVEPELAQLLDFAHKPVATAGQTLHEIIKALALDDERRIVPIAEASYPIIPYGQRRPLRGKRSDIKWHLLAAVNQDRHVFSHVERPVFALLQLDATGLRNLL